MSRNHAHYQVYVDKAGEWRWRLRAANGRVVDSGEGYTSRWHVERAIGAHNSAACDAMLQPIRVVSS